LHPHAILLPCDRNLAGERRTPGQPADSNPVDRLDGCARPCSRATLARLHEKRMSSRQNRRLLCVC
jgi:hypothetical protein